MTTLPTYNSIAKPKKKRILFIQHTLDGGGAEKILVDILNRFDYDRYDVTLLLIEERGVYLDSIPSQVHLKSIYDRKQRLFPKWFQNRFTHPFLPAWDKLEKLKLRLSVGTGKKYDCVISFLEGKSLYYHQFALGRRNITWVHCDLQKFHWTENYFGSTDNELKAYQQMDEIVWVSNQAKLSFEELFNTKFRGRTIYNLIDREFIKKRAAQSEVDDRKSQFVLCTAGRLSAEKRQDRLIRVTGLLVNRFNLDAETWILGFGNEETKLRELASQLGIEDRIKFLGFQKNPYPYIKAADTFVLTSDTEAYSLVVAEALCLGKPVVSTAITGPTELLVNDSGILTELNDEDIASQINRLLTDKEIYDHYCRKATERSAIFDPEATMKQIYAIIDGE